MPDQKVVVIAVIYNSKNEVLIFKRSDDYTPGAHNKWALVGGKVEYGEDPEAAVRREVLEETGLTVDRATLLPKSFGQLWHNKHGQEYQVILLPYRCTVVNDAAVVAGDGTKIGEIRFIEPHDVASYELLDLDADMIALSEENI